MTSDQVLILGLILGFLAGIGVRGFRRMSKVGVPTKCEFWVYIEGESLPPQDQVMSRMITDNPFNRKGRAMIGAREGMIFSDIRLHTALLKKSKNPHLFRPDLLAESPEYSADALSELGNCKSIIRLLYAASSRPSDNRHLQFMPHLASAYADLAGARAIYNPIQERLYTVPEFCESLSAEPSAENPEFHVRTVWESADTFGQVRTYGLAAIGERDILTEPLPNDQRTLAVSAVKELLASLFAGSQVVEPISVEALGVQLLIKREAVREGLSRTRIFRKNEQA